MTNVRNMADNALLPLRRTILQSFLLGTICLSVQAAEVAPSASTLELPETPTYGQPLRGKEEISSVMARTMSGKALKKCLVAAAEAKISSEGLPPPTKTAFAEYVADYLFYDFDPNLFWPHYPHDWQEGMRAALKHALETGYEIENMNRAVELLPVFFPDGKGLENCTYYRSLHMAADYNVWPNLSEDRTKAHRAGVSLWAKAIWNGADAGQRQEIVDRFFAKSLIAGGQRDIMEGEDWWRFQPGLFPLHDWLGQNPDKIEEYLRHPSRDLRQWTAIMALQREPVLDIESPLAIQVMIEGLEDDSLQSNHRLFPKLLVKAGEPALSPMRKAFETSDDLQQQLILSDLLTWLDDPESVTARMEFLYAGLASSKRNSEVDVGKEWGSRYIRFPAGFASAHRAIPMRMIWIGPAAADFLLARIGSSADPQQLALSLGVIANLGVMDRVMWTNHMIDLLADGLKDNKMSYDLGFCAMALRLAGPRPLARLETLAAASPDPQFKTAVAALRAYQQGDTVTYKGLWRTSYSVSSNPTRQPYWEYDLLAPDRAGENRWETIVSFRGDETYLDYFDYRYDLRPPQPQN